MQGLERLADIREIFHAYAIKEEEGAPNLTEDFNIIQEELEYAEAVNGHIFEFYYEGLKGYAGAKNIREEMFYMGLLEVLSALYSKINNVSIDEAKTILADLATKRMEESKKQK